MKKKSRSSSSSMGCSFDSEHFAAKFVYGGRFNRVRGELDYWGGEMRTVDIDPDKISWFDLEDIVSNKVKIQYDHSLYYMLPDKFSFDDGLVRIADDATVLEMAQIGYKHRAIEVYVVRMEDTEQLQWELREGGKLIAPADCNRRGKKLTPRKASKVPLDTLLQVETCGPHVMPTPSINVEPNISSHSNPNSTTPIHTTLDSLTPQICEYDSEDAIEEDVGVTNEGSFDGSEEESEDETYVASEEDLGSEDESYVDSEIENAPPNIQNNIVCGVVEGNPLIESEYEDTDEDGKDPLAVTEHTNFKRFKWVVGLTFPNASSFRECLTRYALAQGRNVKIYLSDKKRQQRLGVECVEGCPFRLYASWDKKNGLFIVKSVNPTHTCQRNMEGNRRLKSNWVAEQLLEMFKSRPHVPSKEIIDVVKQTYSVIINRDFAYKIKHNAHKKLHGSMKQHYNKVYNYLEALKNSSPESRFTVTTIPNSNPPVFQRFFVAFDGLKNGWLQGCRPVLCIDGCFLKTFLGGMLLSAIGRDPNEQMYPLAWAVVEGENNDSWEWFMSELKCAVGGTDGDGWTVLSDEHQAMTMSAGFCMAGWLALYFAKGALTLDIGRLFSGYGIGVLSYVVPIFIAEIAPKELRGGLTTLNQLMIVTGASITFLMGSIISWRALALAGLVPCIALLSGLFFVPESPRWLAKVGRQKQFKLALRVLRGQNADISRESAEIEDYLVILETLPKGGVLDLFQSKYIRSVIIGVGLMVFQQCVGINGIGFYVSQTFVEAGLSSGKLGTIAYAIVQVPITLVGAVLMDKSGRKPLVTISAMGTFIGCFLVATGFLLKSYGVLLDWVPILVVGGVLTYISAFSIGFGGVPWVIMSEIFPLNVKGAAGSLVVLVNWSGAWLVSYTYNFMMKWSTFGTYYIYATFCILTVLFVAKFVPETKGKTLEEIQDSINAKTDTILE